MAREIETDIVEEGERVEALKFFKHKRVKDPEKEREIRGQVFDQSTVEALDSLMRRKVITGLAGVIATGKEANVFLAFTPNNDPVVAKIYKLETSSFHSMSKYIKGDARFEKIKLDRRSIIFNWCKKEYRNLEKATEVGVRVPLPLAFKNNVLVMEFIGSYDKENEKESPSWPLKNTPISEKEARGLYVKMTEYLARLFYSAQLVHADLSEFNILGHKDPETGKLEPVIIDIGQGVLTSHPLAQEFLDRDLEKVQKFFHNYLEEITMERLREDIRAWENKL